MDDYEKRIREKVFNAGILTNGEWVYLIGVFNAAREYEEALAKATPVSNGARGEASALPDDRSAIDANARAR